jgi:hypothetical protein
LDLRQTFLGYHKAETPILAIPYLIILMRESIWNFLYDSAAFGLLALPKKSCLKKASKICRLHRKPDTVLIGSAVFSPEKLWHATMSSHFTCTEKVCGALS